jgi:hypothetical protein
VSRWLRVLGKEEDRPLRNQLRIDDAPAMSRRRPRRL